VGGGKPFDREEGGLGKALGILVGLLVGGITGYMLGYYLACEVFNAGNLCGLFGVFLTGPLGAAAGAVTGWRLVRGRTPQ
jgi:hypothetical protein